MREGFVKVLRTYGYINGIKSALYLQEGEPRTSCITLGK